MTANENPQPAYMFLALHCVLVSIKTKNIHIQKSSPLNNNKNI